jgi:hypothetical protein
LAHNNPQNKQEQKKDFRFALSQLFRLAYALGISIKRSPDKQPKLVAACLAKEYI